MIFRKIGEKSHLHPYKSIFHKSLILHTSVSEIRLIVLISASNAN